jgi:hypothetical protein
MDITINFDNYNAGVDDGVKVYRSDSAILSASLPAPLATLPSGATQYIDTTAVRGSKYYYRFGVVKGADEVLSKNYVVLAVAPADTGPGPQTLQAGDWDLGLFGYCTSANFFSYGGLAAALGVTVGTASTDYGWLKMAFKGKVIFIPRSALRYSVSYNDLYLAGVVFGTNDNGPVVPTGMTPTNQYKIQNLNGFSFVPRMMKGTADGAALPVRKTAADAVNPGSEYDILIGSLLNTPRYIGDLSYGNLGRIDDISGAGTSANASYITTDLVQQMVSYNNAGQTVCRGGRVFTGPPNVAYAVPVPVNSVLAGVSGWSVIPQWRPILELLM